VWLLIEEQSDGKIKYAFSNLPPETSGMAGFGAPFAPASLPGPFLPAMSTFFPVVFSCRNARLRFRGRPQRAVG
jgi:hypothetical protein